MIRDLYDGADREEVDKKVDLILRSVGIEWASDPIKEQCAEYLMEAERKCLILLLRHCRARMDDVAESKAQLDELLERMKKGGEV